MRMTAHTRGIICAAVGIAITFFVTASEAQVSLVGTFYSQDFDEMTTNATGSSTTPAGWFIGAVGADTNGVVGSTSVVNSAGSGVTGTNYNFGVEGAGPVTDRALGSVASSTGNRVTEVRFTNNTGGAITNLNISYDGEQWRAVA